MIDVSTQKRLKILKEGNAAPYMMLPYAQLDEVCQMLNANEISYTVDEEIISINGGPEIAVVDFGRKGDVDRIQALLDSVH